MSSGVYMLIDRSGSMTNQWKEVIGSINTYVENLQPETELFIAVFDSNGYDVVRRGTVAGFTKVSSEEFAPRGGTPLLDASARIMYRAFDDNHDKTILVIMTDGEENSSQKYKLSDVKYLTAQMEAKDWQVLFLGANFDNVREQATSYGLQGSKFMNMTTANFNDSMVAVAGASASYTSGLARSVDFSDADKAAAVKK
jgi:hypothetical protein